MPSNNNKTILPEFLRLRSWEECVYNPVTHQHGVCVGTIQSCVLKMNTGQSERLLFSLRSALLAGYRNTNGTFNNRSSNGNWWSSSASGASDAFFRALYTGSRGVFPQQRQQGARLFCPLSQGLKKSEDIKK